MLPILDLIPVLTIEPESEAFNTRDLMVVMPPFLRINELFVDGASYRFQFTAESFEDAGLAMASLKVRP